jgi:RimJ/RimL family protein N-acetyltransferase
MSGTTAEVRAATVDDVAALVELFEAVAAEGRWIGREAPIDRQATTAQLTEGIGDPARLVLVASAEDRVVGALGLDDDGHGHLGLWMLLEERSRGRRIGSALLGEAIEWARSSSPAHKVALQVWPHNAAAIALYRRHGFVVEGYLHRHWRRRNGELWDAIVMGLPVSGEPL